MTLVALLPRADAAPLYEMSRAPVIERWEGVDEPTLVDRLSGVDRVRVPGADALRRLASHPVVRASGAPALGAFVADCALAAYTYLLVRPVAHFYHNAPGTEHWGMWFGAPPADMCARMTGGVSTASDWTANPTGCYAMIQRRFNGFLTMVHTALAVLIVVRVLDVLRKGGSCMLRALRGVVHWALGRSSARAETVPDRGGKPTGDCCRSCQRLLAERANQ